MINNESKSFDIVDASGIQTIGVKQLTLKEREKLFLNFEEGIKNRRRKEYLEISKLMESKDKNKYLVECANANKISVEEIIEESQTVNGITEIFKVSSNKQLDWTSILSNEEMILPVLKAFYWSLGIDVPEQVEESPIEESPIEQDVKSEVKINEIVSGEAQQEANFIIHQKN